MTRTYNITRCLNQRDCSFLLCNLATQTQLRGSWLQFCSELISGLGLKRLYLTWQILETSKSAVRLKREWNFVNLNLTRNAYWLSAVNILCVLFIRIIKLISLLFHFIQPSRKFLESKYGEAYQENVQTSVLKGMQRVCNSKYSYLIPMDTALAFKHKVNCTVVPLPRETSLYIPQGFAIAKNSPYLGLFNYK